MKNTVEPKFEFIVCTGHLKDGFGGKREVRVVRDGDEVVCVAEPEIHCVEWHKDEMRNNECYEVLDVFTSRRGHQFIHAWDSETGEHFLTRVDLHGAA